MAALILPDESCASSRTYASGRRSNRPVLTASGTKTLRALERVPVGSPCCCAKALMTVGLRPLCARDSAACGVGNAFQPNAAQPLLNFSAYRETGKGGQG